MVESLGRLGLQVEHDPASARIVIRGSGNKIPARSAELFVANSGTSLRFLTAMLGTASGTFQLDGTARMRERPVLDLLRALNGLGADASSDLGTGCPPVTIRASGLDGGFAFGPGRRVEPVPERAPDGPALLPGRDDRRGGRPSGFQALRRHDDGRDGGVRRPDQQPEGSPVRRPAGPLHRPELPDRARRLGRFLLLRRGGRHRGDDHGRRPGDREHPGRPGVRRPPGAHGLRGDAVGDRDHRRRWPAPRDRRGHERDQRHGHDPGRRRPVRPGADPDPERRPTSATRKPTGSRPWPPNSGSWGPPSRSSATA